MRADGCRKLMQMTFEVHNFLPLPATGAAGRRDTCFTCRPGQTRVLAAVYRYSQAVRPLSLTANTPEYQQESCHVRRMAMPKPACCTGLGTAVAKPRTRRLAGLKLPAGRETPVSPKMSREHAIERRSLETMAFSGDCNGQRRPCTRERCMGAFIIGLGHSLETHFNEQRRKETCVMY